MPTLPHDIGPGVKEPFLRFTAEIGRPLFSLEDMEDYVKRWRQKGGTLRIETDKMPGGMSAYAVGLADCDLICTARGLTYMQWLGAIVHELCHFIRGDIAPYVRAEQTPDYAKFIRLRDRHQIATSRQHIDNSRFFKTYDNPIERDTETLARICVKCILQFDKQAPKIFTDIYGD